MYSSIEAGAIRSRIKIARAKSGEIQRFGAIVEARLPYDYSGDRFAIEDQADTRLPQSGVAIQKVSAALFH